MFCSACGRPAIGNFCTACGKPLVSRGTVPAPHFQAAMQMVRKVAPVAHAQPSDAAVVPLRLLPELETVDEPPATDAQIAPVHRPAAPPALPARRMADLAVTFLADDQPRPWDDEVNYRALVQTPEVRELVDRYASQSRKTMTGEELLQLAEKIMPTGVPLDKVMSLFQPLATQMGIGTGQERVERIQAPVGRVLVRVLCSLARHGQSLRHVRQGSDGCALEASLPSDVWALEGLLGITVVRRGGWTDVGAATKIGGQWFDWGKSRRALDQFFADLGHDPY
ncbi:MAG: hypothetical protein K2Y37_14225 [Pirellulales bacterium]|nr:hypothetical protein [Pirellulales bacterium]